MQNQISSDWTRLASILHDELVRLITDEPDLAARLAEATSMAGRLRNLAEAQIRGRESAPRAARSLPHFVAWGVRDEDFRENRASSLAAALRDADPRPRGSSDYRIVKNTLQELNPEGDPSGSSVQFEDYCRIAGALHWLTATAVTGSHPCKAKGIREQTSNSDATSPLDPRTVSLTHVYVCLRFWLLLGAVVRHTGGTFSRPDQQEDFRDVATGLWHAVAMGTEPTAAGQ